jgi:predicted nucleic acid-binding protein
VLIVDAGVWVSAADPADEFSARSRTFLTVVVDRELRVAVPDLCTVEVACALARRLDDVQAARTLADGLFGAPFVTSYELDPSLLRRALELGTAKRLRAAEAIYATVAERAAGQLVAWDRELIARAGAVTPDDWLRGNASDVQP